MDLLEKFEYFYTCCYSSLLYVGALHMLISFNTLRFEGLQENFLFFLPLHLHNTITTTPKSPYPKCSPKCSKRRSLSHAPCCMIFFLGGGSTPMNASSTMATANYLLSRLLIFCLCCCCLLHRPLLQRSFFLVPHLQTLVQ